MSTTKWALDPTHSELQFKVKHLMITNVTGSMGVLSGEVEAADATFNGARVNFTADMNSITTGNEQRDGHLKSPEFFDSAAYPAIRFESEAFNAAEGKINGNLTIRDVTKPVTLDVEF
ncbi:MAG: YceI family protein, partial [Bacteroidia bacterium]